MSQDSRILKYKKGLILLLFCKNKMTFYVKTKKKSLFFCKTKIVHTLFWFYKKKPSFLVWPGPANTLLNPERQKATFFLLKVNKKYRMEMEVDMELLDLNNSSRIVFTTMELVNSLIFTNFYWEFLCISRDHTISLHQLQTFMCTSPLEMLFSQSHGHVVPFTNLILPCLNLVLKIIFHASIFSVSHFYHFHSEFAALLFSSCWLHSCCHRTPIWSLDSTDSWLQFRFLKIEIFFFFLLQKFHFFASEKKIFFHSLPCDRIKATKIPV